MDFFLSLSLVVEKRLGWTILSAVFRSYFVLLLCVGVVKVNFLNFVIKLVAEQVSLEHRVLARWLTAIGVWARNGKSLAEHCS